MPPPPIFICENNRKRNKIQHCVEKKSLSGGFEDMAIFHVSQLSYDGEGALCAHYRSIDKFVKNGPIFKTTNQIFFQPSA